MLDAVIVEAVRTPIGKRNGGLAGVHAVDLSAEVLLPNTSFAGPAFADVVTREGVDVVTYDGEFTPSVIVATHAAWPAGCSVVSASTMVSAPEVARRADATSASTVLTAASGMRSR